MYSDSTHFLYELLQNANDCGATVERYRGELEHSNANSESVSMENAHASSGRV